MEVQTMSPSEADWISREEFERLRDVSIEQGEEIARLQERLRGSDANLVLAREQLGANLELTREHLESYKAQTNEWRGTLRDRDALYVTKTECKIAGEALGDRITTIEKSVNTSAGKGMGVSAVWSGVVIIALIIINVLDFIIPLFTK